MPELGGRIRSARLKAGLTQVRLAELMGVRQPTVANWESGSATPEPAKFDGLSKHLNCTTDYLLKVKSSAAPPAGFRLRPLEKKVAAVNRRAELVRFPRERAKKFHEAVPTWLNAAAGPGMFLELSDDFWNVPKLSRARGIHLAVIRGSSMRETLRPGDYIVMQSFGDKGITLPPIRSGDQKSRMREVHAQGIQNDDIVALSINNEGITIKRVLFQGDESDWYLIIDADNRNEWEPRAIRLSDELTIFAKILGLGSET